MNGAKNTLRTLTTNVVKRTNSIGPVNTSRSRSSSAVSPPLSRRSSSINLNNSVTNKMESTFMKAAPQSPTLDLNIQINKSLPGGPTTLKNGTLSITPVNLSSNTSRTNVTEQQDYTTSITLTDTDANMELPFGLNEEENKGSILMGIQSGNIEYFQLPQPNESDNNVEEKQQTWDDFMMGIGSGAVDFFQMSSFDELERKDDGSNNNYYMTTENEVDNDYWISPSQSNISDQENSMMVFSIDKTPSTIDTSVQRGNAELSFSNSNSKYIPPNNDSSDNGLALGVIDFIEMPKGI